MLSDVDAERLRFILEGQQHCDHFLTPIADPAGKEVLVVGAGAGTEMLWCLRHGARSVLGLDIVPQSTTALLLGAREYGLSVEDRAEIVCMAAEGRASSVAGSTSSSRTTSSSTSGTCGRRWSRARPS